MSEKKESEAEPEAKRLGELFQRKAKKPEKTK